MLLFHFDRWCVPLWSCSAGFELKTYPSGRFRFIAGFGVHTVLGVSTQKTPVHIKNQKLSKMESVAEDVLPLLNTPHDSIGDTLISHEKNNLGVVNGVFVPCMLNIVGAILFLRLSWAVGQAGFLGNDKFLQCTNSGPRRVTDVRHCRGAVCVNNVVVVCNDHEWRDERWRQLLYY